MPTILAVALCAVLAALGAGACPPTESCVHPTLQHLEGDTLDAMLGRTTS